MTMLASGSYEVSDSMFPVPVASNSSFPVVAGYVGHGIVMRALLVGSIGNVYFALNPF